MIIKLYQRILRMTGKISSSQTVTQSLLYIIPQVGEQGSPHCPWPLVGLSLQGPVLLVTINQDDLL
jgi:hypothetical protein